MQEHGGADLKQPAALFQLLEWRSNLAVDLLPADERTYHLEDHRLRKKKKKN